MRLSVEQEKGKKMLREILAMILVLSMLATWAAFLADYVAPLSSPAMDSHGSVTWETVR